MADNLLRNLREQVSTIDEIISIADSHVETVSTDEAEYIEEFAHQALEEDAAKRFIDLDTTLAAIAAETGVELPPRPRGAPETRFYCRVPCHWGRLFSHPEWLELDAEPDDEWHREMKRLRKMVERRIAAEEEAASNSEKTTVDAPSTEPLASTGAASGADRQEKAKGADESEDSQPPDLLPAQLSAPDIATRLKRNPKSVSSFLTRLAGKRPDCRIEVENRRRNEPQYLYRTADVWPLLEKWTKDEPKS